MRSIRKHVYSLACLAAPCIVSSPATAELIKLQFDATVAGFDISGTVVYDPNDTPSTAVSRVTRLTALRLSSAVNGVSLTQSRPGTITFSDGATRNIRDDIDFSALVFPARFGSRVITQVGFSLIDYDSNGNANVLSPFPTPLATPAEYDVFPDQFFDGGDPGGYRAFLRVDSVVRFGTLDSLVVSIVPEPSSVVLFLIAATAIRRRCSP